MNYCNFAKVIMSRSTKDKTSLDYWNSKTDSVHINDSLSQQPKSQCVKSYISNISIKSRYENYQRFMHRYPKMQLSYDSFRHTVPRLQRYITDPKYWENSNRSGEKNAFLENFSLQAWCNLPE